MNICHICSNYDKFFIDFMEQQVLRGTNIRVFYFRAKERGMPDVKAPYLDIRLNYSNWQRLFFYLKEKNVLKDFYNLYEDKRFDVLHAHTMFSNGYIAYKVKKYWNIPYIVAVRSMDINVFLKYRFNLRKIGIKILKESERIIFISRSYRDQVILRYIPKELQKEFYNKSYIIPNGINSFYLSNKYVRRQFDVKKTLQIITVGYISKRKNQITVCEAVKRLNSMGISTEYTIIGNVLDKHILEKIVDYSFVRYIPFMSKDELIKKYRKADIFVMPSITETFGLTYVEAMSQGLPVIYSAGQGFDGYFEEGVVGFSVESMNVENIVKRIIDLRNDYIKISNNCSELCSKFNWEDIESKYNKIYNTIICSKNNA